MRVPVHGLALRGLDFPVAPKDNASGLSHQLAQRWGRKERRKVGFQVLGGQTTKPEVDSSLLVQVCIFVLNSALYVLCFGGPKALL